MTWYDMSEAISQGDLGTVKSFIEKHPLDAPDLEEALGIAIEEDKAEVVALLISTRGVEIDQDKLYDDLLYNGIQVDAFNSIKVMVDGGVIDPDRGLITAAQRCHPKYIKYFVEKGAISFDQALQAVNTGPVQSEESQSDRTIEALTRLRDGLPFDLRKEEENWSDRWEEEDQKRRQVEAIEAIERQTSGKDKEEPITIKKLDFQEVYALLRKLDTHPSRIEPPNEDYYIGGARSIIHREFKARLAPGPWLLHDYYDHLWCQMVVSQSAFPTITQLTLERVDSDAYYGFMSESNRRQHLEGVVDFLEEKDITEENIYESFIDDAAHVFPAGLLTFGRSEANLELYTSRDSEGRLTAFFIMPDDFLSDMKDLGDF